jgi:chromosome segregation ATPase
MSNTRKRKTPDFPNESNATSDAVTAAPPSSIHLDPLLIIQDLIRQSSSSTDPQTLLIVAALNSVVMTNERLSDSRNPNGQSLLNLSSALNQATIKTNQQKEAIDSVTAANKFLQSAATEAKSENARLRALHNPTCASLRSMTAERDALREQTKTLTSKLANHTNQNTSVAETIRNLKNENQDIVASLKQEKIEKTTLINKNKETIDSVTATNQLLQSAAAVANSERAKVQTLLSRSRDSLQTMKAERDASRELNKTLTSQLEHYTNENSSQEETIRNLKKENQDLAAVLEIKKTENTQLSHFNQSIKPSLEAYDESLKQLSANAQFLSNKLQQAEEQLKSRAAQIIDLELQKKDLITEKEKALYDSAELRTASITASENLRGQIQSHEIKAEEREIHIQTLEAQIEFQIANIAQAEGREVYAQYLTQNTTRELEQKESNNVALQAQVSELTDELRACDNFIHTNLLNRSLAPTSIVQQSIFYNPNLQQTSVRAQLNSMQMRATPNIPTFSYSSGLPNTHT